MAKKVGHRHNFSGNDLYMIIIRLSDGFHWRESTNVFEAAVAANWANYDIVMTEGDTASNYFYAADLPSHANFVADHYAVLIFDRIGATPALTDTRVGKITKLYYDGTDIVQGVEVDVDAILVDTGTTLPATLTTIGGKVDTVDTVVDAILVDTGTTLPATLATLATAAALTTVDTVVDSILLDTGTTLPATLTTIDGKIDTVDTVVDAILVDTGTTLPATLATLATAAAVTTIDTVVDAILVDTGTTLPVTLTTIDGKVDTVDTVVDAILVDTGTTIPGTLVTLATSAEVATVVSNQAVLDGKLDTVDTVVDAILVDTGTTLPATIPAAVWDEILTGATHNIPTSAGRRLRNIAGVTQIDGTVVVGTAPTTFTFETNLPQGDDHWNDALIVFTSGVLTGQSKPIKTFTNGSGIILLDEPLTTAPAHDDEFVIYATHIHPISQISGGVWDELSTGHTDAGKAGAQLWTSVDTILVDVEKNRKVLSNKVIITPGTPNVVDVYEDNNSTIAFTLNVTPDGNTRTKA